MTWKYREVQVTDDESIDDSGTETIDLNIKDPITALIARFKVTNAAQACPDVPPELVVSKIEIVDGGQVHWSLNGQEAVAAACYGLRQWPFHWYAGNTSYNQNISIPLLFGRYLGDEEFAFDPRKLLNPQLKFTWVANALHLTTGKTLGITARVMEGLAPPAQCLMWKQVEAWSAASTGEHKVDLPVDLPFRSLMMRAFTPASSPGGIWTHYKLDCDLGKYIPFDLDQQEMMEICKMTDGPFYNRQTAEVISGQWLESWLGECLNVTSGQIASGISADAVTFGGPRVQFCGQLVGGGSAGTWGAMYSPSGYFPHSSVLYRFGRRDVPATWFPAREYGEIALKLTEYASGAVVSTAVQQPVTL